MKTVRHAATRCTAPQLLRLAVILLSLHALDPHRPAAAEDKGAKSPLAVDDLFRMSGPQAVAVSPNRARAAVVQRRVDGATLAERFSLWLVDGDPQDARPAEVGEPDARSAVFSPDGRWIAVRSTRPRPDGWDQTPPVPPQSDAATDVWLVSADGRQSLPLAGPRKPYGRVFGDSFYGRVAFSPDGRLLAFVADDGRDVRTPREREADVLIVRPDQGEGYTGYGTAQVWVAELAPEPTDHAARSIRRLTHDDVWYGDPQWTPDGRRLVCHANKTDDRESVRYSINKDFDLWSIDVETGRQRRLTDGPGPQFSPRIAPDGQQLVCLSSPRKGPHVDVFNLLVVPLTNEGGSDEEEGKVPPSHVVFDHHGEGADEPPHPDPSFPLPEECWDGSDFVVYSTAAGTATETVRLDLRTGNGSAWDGAKTEDESSGLSQRLAARRRLTPRGNAFLEDRLIAKDEVFEWTNDGLQLDGVITVPPPEIAEAPYPLVVFPHGGPHSRSTRGFNFTAQVLAAHGYLVFQPNFRGSAGYGRKFLDADRRDLGGGDMRDILTGIEALIERKLAEGDRQFVYGVSYGGFMTSWLVGHTGQFRAAVAQNAVTDMNVMWGLSDLQSWTEWELGGRPWEVPEAMRRHSPITYADKVTTPTLMLHSREDRRCPLAMGRMFHQSLLARGVPTQMVVYPDEGHGIRQPRHQADVLRRVLAWFRRHDPAAAKAK